MNTIYKHELRAYSKTVLIWFACVAGMGFACILLFSSMKEDMAGMAENFATMGAFSDAFGMSQLSIATLTGFYATEVGTIHALGGAMFAAILGTCMLSKEEDGHTGEFLLSLPVARRKVVLAKWLALVSQITVFNLLCVGVYVLGFVLLGEELPAREFFLYHLMQVVMELELSSICYALSSFLRKNQLGLGLGIVLFFYVYDLMARVIPDMADFKLFSPFSYANAADILSTGELETPALTLGAFVLLLSASIAFYMYGKRDLAP